MISLINVISFLLVLGCGYSSTPDNVKKDLTYKTAKNSLQVVNSPTQTLVKLRVETVTITVSYAGISCGCPQWFETKFKKKKFLSGVERFYLEPTSKTLMNANDLWDGQTLPLTLKLIGGFSKGQELPKTHTTKTSLEKARVFRYDKIMIISRPKTAN